MTARTAVAVVIASACVISTPAQRDASAFCGFYVAGADSDLFNNATVVAMMREGTRTVLSMQNNYQGPPENFAMVVPVPVVLREDQVKTLPRDIFSRLDKLAAPRLVEYWEQDPCPLPMADMEEGVMGAIGSGSGGGSGYGRGVGGERMVVVEAEFTVGEYEIVILSAKDAFALEGWLTGNGYKIPAGAGAYLRPYVEGGSKFFVAKVNIDKVEMKDGMAMLSPLRFHYDTEDFSLPVRLGLINSAGTQDLIVHILAQDTRYEVANYPNATIPTNLFVGDVVRERFGEFYAALLDATLEKNRGAVVTEYAWSAGSCDPCPESPLSDSELATLGLDVLFAGKPFSAAPKRAFVRPAGPLQVRGDSLPPQVIARYMRRYAAPMSACYQQALAAGQSLDGRAEISFRIERVGNVAAVKVKGVADAAVSACIEGTIARFPLPRVKKTTHVTVPILLSSRAVSGGAARRFVLTRLHARYGVDALAEDLVFKRAGPIEGGRGGAGDGISQDASAAGQSTFQGRYIIRHPWEGEIACENPRRGMWGGPPPTAQIAYDGPTAATDLAFVKRGAFRLDSAVTAPVPALALDVGTGPITPPAAMADTAVDQTVPSNPKRTRTTGCGCSAGGSGQSSWLVALFALALWRRRRTATNREATRAPRH